MSWFDDEDEDSEKNDSQEESDDEEFHDGEFDVYVCYGEDRPASNIKVWIEYESSDFIPTGGVESDYTDDSGHASFPVIRGHERITIHVEADNGPEEQGPLTVENGDSFTFDISD